MRPDRDPNHLTDRRYAKNLDVEMVTPSFHVGTNAGVIFSGCDCAIYVTPEFSTVYHLSLLVIEKSIFESGRDKVGAAGKLDRLERPT
jgi:hypothetical protein